MKLWDKGIATERLIEDFTVGEDRHLDRHLAPFDVMGTLAHTQMLSEIGLIPREEYPLLRKALLKIYHQIEAGDFEIEPDVEDVHSQVELMLTRELGDIGKKVHSGRSRNDQVLVDLKLFFLHEVEEIVGLARELFQTLQQLSEQHKDILLPGYTHLQIAMPSSFGLWLGAYAESLIDDVVFFQAAHQVANQNPLGSAAGYGNSFPLNRTRTTELLGFQTLAYNVVYAQMGRGKTERLLGYAIAAMASTLNKLATDVCLYMNQNFGFIRFPDELTTGSSIMPHKKNPDVFELIRARSNRLQSLPGTIGQITTNLPSGYFRDLQLIKELVFPAIEELKSCLHLTDYMLRHLQVNPAILDDPKYDYLFSVERVNELVLQGMPFRDAYKAVGQEIAEGRFQPQRRVVHTHEGSIGHLCHAEINEKMAAACAAFGFDRIRAAWQQLIASS